MDVKIMSNSMTCATSATALLKCYCNKTIYGTSKMTTSIVYNSIDARHVVCLLDRDVALP